jgi:hypothetical protein
MYELAVSCLSLSVMLSCFQILMTSDCAWDCQDEHVDTLLTYCVPGLSIAF